MISDEDKDKVRAATDLVELVQETVELKPRGSEFWGCCPFHGEKTPSFHIIPSTQVWHCFGCGEGGDVFTYTMKRENLSFPDSIRYLAERAGIEISDEGPARKGAKRSRLIDVCEETSQFFHTMLMRGKDGRGREYCSHRGLSADVCRRYRLGYSVGRNTLVAHLSQKGFTPREMIDANVAFTGRGGGLVDRFYERVMFPIFDEQGKCIAFGGRITGDGEPKYLNTSETPLFHKKRNLYGFNWAKEHIVAQGEAVVVEGYTDCIACWEAGLGNVVATLGTALTEHHVKTLTRFAKKIIYLFDGDAAGQKAAERAIQFIEKDSVDLRCVILPDNLDPNDFVHQFGGQALRDMLDASVPLMDFVYRKLEERSDTSTPGGRARALEDACRLIYPLRSSYVIDTYFMQIADRLGVDVDMVRDVAPRVFRDVQKEEEASARRAERYERQRRDRESSSYRSDASRSRSGSLVAPAASQGAWSMTGSIALADVASAPVDGGEPYDYVPLDAYEDAPYADEAPYPDAGEAYAPAPAHQFAVALTDLERRSLACERELLTLLTAYPDDFRPNAERITEIEWVEPRNETIAWAVLATPEGTSPQDVMAAARAVCPDAAQRVSAGTIDATSKHPTQTNIAFLLDSLELFTLRRRMKASQSKLRSDKNLTAEERRAMAIQATQDAARARELAKAVEGVADPFRNL